MAKILVLLYFKKKNDGNLSIETHQLEAIL